MVLYKTPRSWGFQILYVDLLEQKPSNPISMGGIAAAAALAARKKNRQRDDKSTEFMKDDEQEDVEMKSITAAALGKFSRTAENVNEMYSTEFEDHCALRQIDSGIICGTSGSQTRA